MEWISVKDRLPEEDIVLTYDGFTIRSAEILYEDENEIVWLDGGVCFSNVTHWMPLPEPPKQQEKLGDFCPYPGG